MGNCKIIQVDDPIYKGLLQKHNGDNKAALDEYISSKALPLQASVADITSTIVPHNSNVAKGFTVDEEVYATNIFTNYVAQTINAIQNTTQEKAASYKDQGLKDFFTKAANMNVGNLGDATKEGFDTVRNLAISYYVLQLRRIAKSVSPEQKAFNAKVLEELRKTDSLLWSKVKNELKVQYGFIITEENDLLNANNELPTGWGDEAQFTINPNNRLSAEIKLHINSTPDVNPDNYTVNKIGSKVHQQVVDNFGGIPKTLNFKEVVPHLMDYLPSATSVDDMMKKLMNIVDTKYPSLKSLYQRLTNDESLRNLFFSNFYQPAPMQVASKVSDKDGTITVDTTFHNKSGFSIYRLADTFVRNLKSNLQTGKYNSNFLSANLDRINAISSQILGSDNKSLKVAKLNELFNEVGINTTAESIEYIINNQGNRDTIKVPANKISQLQYQAKQRGLELTDAELIQNHIDDRVILENLLNPFKYITDYITRNAELVGTKTPVGDFDQYGTILQLAEQLRLFHAPVSNNSVLNVHGEREYSNSNPSFIDDFFTLRNDKVAFTNRLRQYMLEPSNHFSNWLTGENGLLTIPKSMHNGDGNYNLTPENIHLVTLNEEVYNLFNYKLFAGVSNESSNVGNTYSEISDTDWDLIQMQMFHTGGVETKSNPNQIGILLPTPSDRNNTRVINTLKYALDSNNYSEGKVLKDTSLYNAIRNTVNQEIARMISASRLVERAIAGELLEDNLPLENKLLNGYHYITDDNGKKIFKDEQGNYTGSVFNFYNTNYNTQGGKVISLNDNLNINDILSVQNPYLNNQIKEKIEAHLDGFLDNTIANEILQYKDHTSFIRSNITTNTKTVIAELALNYYIANVEMVNMFMGSPAMYGAPGKANNAMNKRATQLLASGKGNVGFGNNQTFKSISITEAVLKNSQLVKDIYKQLVNNKLDPKDATRISQMYASIDVADGQSYITLDEFENRLKMSGLDKRYTKLLESLRDPNAVLTEADMSNFVQLQKNFYYGMEYDETLGMNVPDQIKNSEYVLIPKFIAGTQLETLHNIMKRNDLAQVDMASARKVGHRNIVSLFNSNTFAIEDTGEVLDNLIKSSTVELKYQNLKRQQDIANHIKDSKNKLGTQIARAIITNINKPGTVKEYFNLLKHNIEEYSAKLLSDMGITQVGDAFNINHTKLIKFIEQEVIDRDLNNNFVEGIKLNEQGNPNIPLDFNIQRRKYISILTSLFSNRVIDQKFPGVHGPQLSNLFMDKIKQEGLSGQTETSTFRKLEYQRYENGKFKEAEVLMPAWSKEFFKKDGNITIEELQKAGLADMIGYRIPTEDKHSMFVFKVVGFLDESQGSTIVVPFEFMAQTGADFDIDSIYSMRYNHYTDKAGNIQKHKYYKTNEEIWDNRYQKTIDFKNQLDTIVAKEEEAFVNDDSAASKILQAMMGTMPDQFTDTELDEIFQENGYSLKLYNSISDKVNSFPSKEEFMAKSVEQNNGRKARENRILDLYRDILSSPETYEEMASSSSFPDTTNATDEANKASGDLSNITNYNTRLSQREYRKRVLSGRELKAQSVIRDGLNAISQIVGVRINDKVAPIIKYDLNEFSLEHLQEVFGKDNVDNDGTVKHTYLANNATGTFKNVLGRLVTSYSAQSTAHILDNVKFPLPKGVNAYTFKVWKTFADLGGTWEFATKFINQPIIEAISNYYSASNSAYAKGSKQIFALAKSDYQKQLIKLIATNKDNSTATVQARKLLKSANKTGNLFIPKTNMDIVYSEVFGYKVGEQTAFTEKQLETMLSQGNSERLTQLDTKDKIDYYRNQLRLLENFIIYDNIAKELGVLNNVTSFDKASVGPSFENASDRIAKIHSLHTDFMDGNSAIHVNNESAVTHIFPKYMRSVYNKESEVISNDLESKYSVLEDYLLHGFVTPINSVGKEFINFSKGFRLLNSLFPNVHDESFTDKLHTYAIAYGLRNLRFFNSEANSKAKVLGIGYTPGDKVDITEINPENVALFKSKPLAIKLALVKDQYSDLIDETNILNSLNGIFDKDFLEKNGYYGVRYDVTLDDNTAIESFANLWYNTNPYLHLLAQDLVRYAYITKGLSFGNNNFSKIIPSQILYSPSTVFHNSNGVNFLDGIGATREFEKFKMLNTDSLFSTYNYDVNFAIKFSRSNSKNRSIVSSQRTTWIEDEKKGMTVDAKSINWYANEQGYIILDNKEYMKLDYNDQQLYVHNIQYHRGDPKTAKYSLFAHFAEYGESRELDVHYFFPVTPLESNEFTNKSYNEANNVHPDPTMRKSLEEYLTMTINNKIDTQVDQDISKFGEVVNPLSSIETKILEKEGTLIVDRSSNIAEELNLNEQEVRTFEANDTTYLISNLGYNVINESGASRWQYVISKVPAFDNTLKASVLDPLDSNMALNNNQKRINIIKEFTVNKGKRDSYLKDDLLHKTVNQQRAINYEKDSIQGQELAFRLEYNYAFRTIEDLKEQLNDTKGFSSDNYFESILSDRVKQIELTNFLLKAGVFLRGFEYIKKLTTINEENMSEDELKLNKAINDVKSLGSDIDSLIATVDGLREYYFNKVTTALSTNPDIISGFRGMFDKGADESVFQKLLDSLLDSNVPFIANMGKRYMIIMGRAKIAYKTLQDSHAKTMAKFKAEGHSIESLLEKDSNGKVTNRFIREFSDEYKQTLSDYNDKLNLTLAEHGKYSKQYYRIEKEFDEWKYNNLEHEDQQEVLRSRLDAQDILRSNIPAREVLETIRNKETEIRDSYSTSLNKGDISDSDLLTLNKLKQERLQLASPINIDGTPKTGKDLDIANTIKEFNKAFTEHNNKFSESIVDPNFDRQLKKHIDGNTAEDRKWIAKNTKAGFIPKFFEDLAKAFATLGKGNQDTERSSITAPYKDENGVINGNEVPKEIVAKLKKDQEEKYEEVDANGNKSKGILKPFISKNNIVTTDAYKTIMEEKGDSENDNDRNDAVDRMNSILNKYATEENGIDYSAISLADLATLKDIKDDMDILSGYNVSDSERADWQSWYKENHESSINEAAFRAMSEIAASKGDEYKKAWDELNTSTTIDPKYFDMIAVIYKEIYGDKVGTGVEDGSFMQDQIKVDSLRGDLLRKSVGNVEDFNDLNDEDKRRVGNKTKSGLVPSGDHSLNSLLKDGIIVITTKDGVPHTETQVFGSIDVLQAAVKRMYEEKKVTKRVQVKDRIAAISQLATTAKYDKLLAKHGINSEWYMNNHTLDHVGNIIPLPMWTNTLPKDVTLYSKDSADKRFWGTSKVTNDKYIDAAKTEAKTWLNNNVQYGTTDYYKQAALANEGNEEWFNANHIVNPYTGQYEPLSIWKQMNTSNKDYINEYKPDQSWTSLKTKDEYKNDNYRSIFGYALPRKSSTYYNPKFEEIQSNPLYQYLKPLLEKLAGHIQKDTIITDGQLPIVYKHSDKSAIGYIKNLIGSIRGRNDYAQETIGENDEVLKFLSLPYLTKLSQPKNKLLPKIERIPGMTDLEYTNAVIERKQQNAEISKTNAEFQQAHLDRDFEGVIRNFIQAATVHKFKSEFEPEIKLALEQANDLKFELKKSSSKVQRDARATNLTPLGLESSDDDIASTKDKGANAVKHFEMWVNMVFYNNMKANEGNLVTIANVIQNFTSAKGMWINIPGAFNNVAYGKTQIAMERFAGYHFDNTTRLKAEGQFWGIAHKLFGKEGSVSTVQEGLIHLMDVVELHDEQSITGNPEVDKHLIKQLLSRNTLYGLHHIGEQYMQNVSMLAMAHSNHIVDGKARSWGEYSNDLRINALRSAMNETEQAKFDDFIAKNKNKDIYRNGQSDMLRDYILKSDTKVQQAYLDHLTELNKSERDKFDQYPTVFDSYEVHEGHIKLKEGSTFSEDEFSLFRNKVIHVNQKIHGIYNSIDANTIQYYAIGRLAMQFRKFLRPGWNKRFGSKFGKKFWNESRNEYDQGAYVAFTRFLTKPFIDNLSKDARGNEEFEVMTAFKNIASDYMKYASNTKLYWNTLDNGDKSGVKQTLVEMSYLLGTLLLGGFLRGLGDKDPDLKDTKNYAYALYLQSRLQQELTNYSPYGWINSSKMMMKNPFAATTTIEDMFGLAYTSMFEHDAIYKGGMYSKHDKLTIKASKMIPLLNRVLRYETIQSQAGYYKLY